MQLLDGLSLSQKIIGQLKSDIHSLAFPPALDIIVVGDDPASLKYVAMKQKKAAEIGIGGQVHRLPQQTDPQDLIDLIKELNSDPEVTALMLQLPLPSNFDSSTILQAIDPAKDADGLNPLNLGKLFQSNASTLIPATALGIIKLLKEYNIDLAGKCIAVINDSPVVGLPLMALLDQSRATVTVCHKYTNDLKAITSVSDIVVSATGVKNLISADFIKEGAVVVDVGGGDVDFESVKNKCSFITPTFGGVGPMTIACLLLNTYTIAINR